MQLKKIALAALATVGALPAFAAIYTGSNSPNREEWNDPTKSELVFWASNSKGSFVKDLGISWSDFASISKGNLSLTLGGADWAAFQGFGGTGTQWGVFAIANNELGFTQGDRRLWSTFNDSVVVTNEKLANAVDKLMYVALDADIADFQAKLGGVNVALLKDTGRHAEVAAKSGVLGYADTYQINIEFNNGGNIGDTLSMKSFSTSVNGWDSFEAADTAAWVNGSTTVNFDGSTLTISTVTAPVPEPTTYALMVAGLAAVGFVARRRKAA